MIQRRCFTSSVTESDTFRTLTPTAQSLYLHLCMQADDDGFVNNALEIAASQRGGKAGLALLEEKRFVLKVEGIYIIKHWKMANYLKSDRLNPLAYEKAAERIWVRQSRAYTDHPVEGAPTLRQLRDRSRRGKKSAHCPPTVSNREDNREEKGKVSKPTNNQTGGEPETKEIIRQYPAQRRGNQETGAALLEQMSGEERQQVLEGILAWKQTDQWQKEKGRYIPMLENFLRRELWRDPPEDLEEPQGTALGQAELEAIQAVLRQEGGEDLCQADLSGRWT